MKSPTIRKKTDSLMAKITGYTTIQVPISRDFLSRLSRRVGAILKIAPSIIEELGNSLVGQVSSEQVLEPFLYYVIANLDSLKSGDVLIYGRPRFVAGDVEVRFGSVVYEEKQRATVKTRILTGEHCGNTFFLTKYFDVWRHWLPRIGYSKFSSGEYWQSSLHTSIPGLCAKVSMLTVQPHTRTLEECVWDLIDDNSVIAFNRKHILSYRRGRLECPHGFAEEQCLQEHFCCLGCPYGMSRCRASGHEDDCRLGICARCGREALIPEGRRNCLLCLTKAEEHSEEMD